MNIKKVLKEGLLLEGLDLSSFENSFKLDGNGNNLDKSNGLDKSDNFSEIVEIIDLITEKMIYNHDIKLEIKNLIDMLFRTRVIGTWVIINEFEQIETDLNEFEKTLKLVKETISLLGIVHRVNLNNLSKLYYYKDDKIKIKFFSSLFKKQDLKDLKNDSKLGELILHYSKLKNHSYKKDFTEFVKLSKLLNEDKNYFLKKYNYYYNSFESNLETAIMNSKTKLEDLKRAYNIDEEAILKKYISVEDLLKIETKSIDVNVYILKKFIETNLIFLLKLYEVDVIELI
ncbi:hypothetical protein QK694_s9gp1 [Emaravirus camelliae]|uniref:Uncharacterized protein n=1 Tax=Emaravirus camelliae TaxID=2843907 RepID=A0A6B9QQK8_9VIRU|nr:hypothetical protein QK694_s9gp1 [Emaravirus camelliae]QHG11081.1 hypothetical protein [Emaravirus camelliae]